MIEALRAIWRQVRPSHKEPEEGGAMSFQWRTRHDAPTQAAQDKVQLADERIAAVRQEIEERNQVLGALKTQLKVYRRLKG